MVENLIGPREEGQTPIDDLSGLLLPIKTQRQLNDAESKNNSKAYAKYILFAKPTSKFDPFTYQSFCGIHKDMFGEVWSWAGEIRKTIKNMGSAPAEIGSEIHRFLFDFHQWEEKGIRPLEVAVKIHHRLVQIHPFENGNGRWARLVTNIYLRRKRIPLIKWSEDQDFIRKVFKPRYIAALKAADHGDYEPLSRLHEAWYQKDR